MGPRSCERGNYNQDQVIACTWILQWGRAHVSAETLPIQFVTRAGKLLQWGRAHVSAETNSQRVLTLLSWELQWGRAHVSAETNYDSHKLI